MFAVDSTGRGDGYREESLLNLVFCAAIRVLIWLAPAFALLQRFRDCTGLRRDSHPLSLSNPLQTVFAVDSTGRVDGYRAAVLRNLGIFAAIRVRVYHSISSTL